MSHPVFLSSSTFSHMPIGSENQWTDFFRTASFELEANAFIPILWLMLFKQENLYWAKYTDLLDFNDPRNQNELEEYQETAANQLYAYLIAEQKQALNHLDERKNLFIEIFGVQNQIYFEQFKQLIQQQYPTYILLRTSGLALDLNDDSFLTQSLDCLDLENLELNRRVEFIENLQADFARFDDYPYFFYGVNNHALIQLKNHRNFDQNPKNTDTNPQPSGLAIWICTAIVTILTLTVWFTTHSKTDSLLAFFVSAFVLGFISSKLGQHT